MNLPIPACLALLFAALPLVAHALTPSQVFDKVKSSVVVIKTLDAKGEETTFGSGVVLPSGKIATNCHVVKDGVSFQAGHGKSFVPATLYAGDADKDLCLLQANKLGGSPVQLGKAAMLKVGEAVYAVGAPRGLELSLSDGIVSQLRGSSPPMIQTTAAISPGSSGGGLFDSTGRLVGITTLYLVEAQNLNFAMPVEWLAVLKPGKKSASKQRSQIDWLTRAEALKEKKDWPKLLASGKQWVKTEPDNALAWSFIGEAHQGLYQWDPSIDAYRQALRINPEHASAWESLGLAYHILKRYDDAIFASRQALRIKPELAKAWGNLGKTYAALKRHDDAIDASRQALRINPEVAEVWYDLGDAYDALKRYDDAIDAYRQSLRIDPESAYAWSKLGVIYAQLERYDDAITASRQALRINPADAAVLYLMGSSYHMTGNSFAALQTLKTLRALDPVWAENLFELIVPR